MSEPDGTPAAVSDEMVDATAPILRSLMRSHGAPIGTEAAECWVRDILAAVVPLIRAQVAAELSGWPFDGQVAEALRRLDPDAPLDLREHPGTGRSMEGIEGIPDGVTREYDLGYLSLPAEIQAEAEQAVSAGTPQPLLVPTGPPRDPHAATVPFEAFVGDHPDHIGWVRDTGRCMASGPHECVTGASAEGQERSKEQK